MPKLAVTATATSQIRDAAAWWLEHRQAAPALFLTELRRAFELITTFPSAGALTTNVEIPEVRRVLLPRSRYHVYYVPADESVTVIAVWHTSRGEEPVT